MVIFALICRFGTMFGTMSVRNAITLALMLLVLAEYSESMPAIDKDRERFLNSVNVSTKRKSA